MGGWLKALIAAACLVVIAGGGYYAWSEYKAGERQALLSEKRACDQRLRDVGRLKTRSDDQQFLTRCVFRGYLTTSEIEATRKKVLGG